MALRIAILGVVVLAVFAVLFLRLWALQVLSGADYLNAAENNQLRTVRVPAPRGDPRKRRRARRQRRRHVGAGLARRPAEGATAATAC